MSNNSNEKLPRGFALGGAIGGVIGVFLCIATGFLDGIVWVFLVTFFVGGIIGAKRSAKNAPKREEKQRVAQKQYVMEYKVVAQRLPKEQMDRLGNTLACIIRCLMAEGFENKDMPIELSKMASVVMTFMKENRYGTLTTAQCKTINKVLDDFEESIKYVLPAMHKSLNQAANKGLGFGVIGSSADVALYSAMDTAERMKNIKSSIKATGQLIDKKVKTLLIDLQAAINN